MIEPRLLLCSGIKLPENHALREGRRVVALDSLGPEPNVNLRLEDVARVFLRHLKPRLVDLLEIATYVYTADCATRRGEGWLNDHTTEPWPRDFQFVIPVRDVDFWRSDATVEALQAVLSFLSDDKFAFQFEPLSKDRPIQGYLQFGDSDDWPFQRVERVLMFSGGLDSLAGAVETAAKGGKLVLVSHRPVGMLDSRQRELYKQLRTTFPSTPMIHVPVWINKDSNFGREHYQRTRSFLYSALGVVVAESVEAEGVRFFENGIVSLNLPVADEVLRARASRTTHPLSLDMFSSLYRLVTDREFVVDNPYVFKTKKEVVSLIANHGAAELIRHTCSCAHTGHFSSKSQWHCGTCSQCIDRRIAVLAAGLESQDPETDYRSDVFTGQRKDGYERNMAVNYVRHAVELEGMTPLAMATKFNLGLTRAARPFPKRREAAECFVDMHQRHAETVTSVVQQQLQKHLTALVEGRLDESSMLASVAGQKHLESSWKRYADRILELLRAGLPIACKTHKPKDEPHLQEICDGILTARESDLVREFPFMRWASSLTKPDWSAEPLLLWVELKYVRTKSDVRPITEAIAADITKYGDSGRRVLFVVYDPQHLITDEARFSEEIVRRPTMLVDFIR